MSLGQRCWFASATILGLVFLFVLPPYQGADEYKHWIRAWSVAEGQVWCGDLPQAAIDARRPFRGHRFGEQFGLVYVDGALAQEPVPGMAQTYRAGACAYPAFAYLVPAFMIRAVVYGGDGHVSQGDPVRALYAARIANWLLLCGVVFWFLRVVPEHRNVALFFLSIPEVFDQSGPLGTDVTLFVLMFVILGMLLRTPTWRRVVVIGVATVLMTVIKPVFALLGLLALPALVELRARKPGWRWHYPLVALALLALPLLVWRTWTNLTPASDATAALPEGSNPGQQIALLTDHPERIYGLLQQQYRDFFEHDLMRGSWTSVLGGFGPARVELPMEACWLLLIGLGLAIYADLGNRARQSIPPPQGHPALRGMSWTLAALGVAVIIPATIMAMYVYYSEVGAPFVYGVQGRYYIVAFFLLLVLFVLLLRLPFRRWRPPAGRVATWLAAIVCVRAGMIAVAALAQSYWYTG